MLFFGFLLHLVGLQCWAAPGEVALLSDSGEIFISDAVYCPTWRPISLPELLERDSSLSKRQPRYQVQVLPDGTVGIFSRLRAMSGERKPVAQFRWPGASSSDLGLHIDGDRVVYFHDKSEHTIRYARFEDDGKLIGRVEKLNLTEVGNPRQVVARPEDKGLLILNDGGDLYLASPLHPKGSRVDHIYKGGRGAEIWQSGNSVLFWNDREWGTVNNPTFLYGPKRGNSFLPVSDKQLPKMLSPRYWVVPASTGNLVEWLHATPGLPEHIAETIRAWTSDNVRVHLAHDFRPLPLREVAPAKTLRSGRQFRSGPATPSEGGFSAANAKPMVGSLTGRPNYNNRSDQTPRILVKRAARGQTAYLVYDRVHSWSPGFTIHLPPALFRHLGIDSGALVEPFDLDLILPVDGVWVNYAGLDDADAPARYYLHRIGELRTPPIALTGEMLIRFAPWNTQETVLVRKNVSPEALQAALREHLKCASRVAGKAR